MTEDKPKQPNKALFEEIAQNGILKARARIIS
jgi:hypothetical protein